MDFPGSHTGRCWGRRRSETVFTGLKVASGTSTKSVFQWAIEPFQGPGRSRARSSLPCSDDYFGEDDIVRLEDDYGRTDAATP